MARSVARRRAYFTSRMVARHSGDVCDQVPMARSRSSNHGAELTYGDEKIVIFCDCLVRAFCENPIFMWKIRFFLGLSV